MAGVDGLTRQESEHCSPFKQSYYVEHGRRLTRTLEWFGKAAQNGVAGAEFMLGVMCLEGMGVKPDPNIVMYWYLKAAEKNIPKAHVNLGNMYLKGHGVHQSYEKAAQWYGSAAALGDAGAQDNARAFAWLNIAAVHGTLSRMRMNPLLNFLPDSLCRYSQIILSL